MIRRDGFESQFSCQSIFLKSFFLIGVFKTRTPDFMCILIGKGKEKKKGMETIRIHTHSFAFALCSFLGTYVCTCSGTAVPVNRLEELKGEALSLSAESCERGRLSIRCKEKLSSPPPLLIVCLLLHREWRRGSDQRAC